MWIIWTIINLLVAIVLVAFTTVTVVWLLWNAAVNICTKCNIYELTDPYVYMVYNWTEEVIYENKYSAIVGWYARQLNKLARILARLTY